MNANHHTHTYRCKHATGDVDDYCRAARRAELRRAAEGEALIQQELPVMREVAQRANIKID